MQFFEFLFTIVNTEAFDSYLSFHKIVRASDPIPDEQYKMAAKIAKKQLLPDRLYVFRQGTKLGHQCLILGRVKDNGKVRTFEARLFELRRTKPVQRRISFGGSIRMESKEVAYLMPERQYKFLGTGHDELTAENISRRGQRIITDWESYNLLGRNCQSFCRQLLKDMQPQPTPLVSEFTFPPLPSTAPGPILAIAAAA